MFPPSFRTQNIQNRRRSHPCPCRWQRTCGRDAAWLRRHRRHVGAAGRQARRTITRWWCRTCAGWDSRRILKAVTRRKRKARDVARVLDKLKIDKADLVTHDIGNMVGYAFAAQYPDRVTRWVVMDAPLPGIGSWDEIVRSPALWHFNFRGPDVERLVKGRERIYLDRFWNELSANPKSIDEATRRHYAKLYARPGAMHSAFNQFAAFTQDAIDNKALAAKGKLAMPVLAIGAEKSFGAAMADELRFVATDVTCRRHSKLGPLADGRGSRRRRSLRSSPS